MWGKYISKPVYVREQQHSEGFNQETSYLERRATHFRINNFILSEWSRRHSTHVEIRYEAKCFYNLIKFPLGLSDCQPHWAVTQRALAFDQPSPEIPAPLVTSGPAGLRDGFGLLRALLQTPRVDDVWVTNEGVGLWTLCPDSEKIEPGTCFWKREAESCQLRPFSRATLRRRTDSQLGEMHLCQYRACRAWVPMMAAWQPCDAKWTRGSQPWRCNEQPRRWIM